MVTDQQYYKRGTVQSCYRWDVKCPSQAHVLEHLAPAGGDVWDGRGAVRRWSLLGGNKPLQGGH